MASYDNQYSMKITPASPNLRGLTTNYSNDGQNNLGGIGLGDLYELDYDRNKIEQVFNQGTDAQYALMQKENRIAENQYANNQFASQQSAVEALRQQRNSQIASGMARGLNAAQEQGTILGVQQNAMSGALELANQRQLEADKIAAEYANNVVKALQEANSVKQAMAQVGAQLYEADMLGYTGELNAAAQMDANATNRYGYDLGLEGTKYAADQTLAGTQYNADKNYAASVYGADKNLEGVIHTANKNLEGTIYNADQNLAGTKYNADQNLLGTKYNADQVLAGTKYNADQVLAGTKYNADKNYAASVQAANIQAAAQKAAAAAQAAATRYAADVSAKTQKQAEEKGVDINKLIKDYGKNPSALKSELMANGVNASDTDVKTMTNNYWASQLGYADYNDMLTQFDKTFSGGKSTMDKLAQNAIKSYQTTGKTSWTGKELGYNFVDGLASISPTSWFNSYK